MSASAATQENTPMPTVAKAPTAPHKTSFGRLESDVKPPTDTALHQLTLKVRKINESLDMCSDTSPTSATSASSNDGEASSRGSRASARSHSAPPTSRTPVTSSFPTTPITPVTPAVALNSPDIEAIRVPNESQLNRRFNDAQMVHPGRACIFVGNLPASYYTDNELNAIVEHEFSRFGECYVRVERVTREDGVKMPHALVQFTNTHDSRLALNHGHKINVQGRQFRVEPSRAKRSVLIGHLDGSYIYVEEASSVLKRFGQVERVGVIHTTNAYGTPFWYAKVTFVTYGAYAKARKAFQAFPADPVYTFLI